MRGRFFNRDSSFAKPLGHLRMAAVLADKNLAVIRNNKVRNEMLRLGFAAGATFVFPWDSATFIPPSKWQEIIDALQLPSPQSTASAPTSRPVNGNFSTESNKEVPIPQLSSVRRYVYVPMARVTSNEELLSQSFQVPRATEEPQLIFHRTATARFNESLPYGCGPKVDLLFRLGIPGRWDILPKFSPGRCYSLRPENRLNFSDALKVVSAGVVMRLESGKAELEKKIEERGRARAEGMERIIATAHFIALAQRLRRDVVDLPTMLMLYDNDALTRLLAAARADVEWATTVLSVVVEAAAKEVTDERSALHAALVGSLAGNLTLHGAASRFLALRFRKPPHCMSSVRDGAAVCYALDSARLVVAGGVTNLNESEVDRWVGVAHSTLIEDCKKDEFNTSRGLGWELAGACLAAWRGDRRRVLRHTALASGRMYTGFGNGVDVEASAATFMGWLMLGRIAERVGVDVWNFGESVDGEVGLLGREVEKWRGKVPGEAGLWVEWVANSRLGLEKGGVVDNVTSSMVSWSRVDVNWLVMPFWRVGVSQLDPAIA